MSQHSYTAIITARGGSKGLPRKNILLLAGIPLIAHTIKAARESECFKNIVVSTDCPEIKLISQDWGATVIDRPKYLATDTASSLDVIHHSLYELEAKGKETSHFALLQPTSPLRNSNHIKEAIKEFEEYHADSLVSITEFNHPYQKGFTIEEGQLSPITNWSDLTSPRQKLQKGYYTNGAIYLANHKIFMKNKNIFHGKSYGYILSKHSSIDIDDKFDLDLAEFLINNHHKNKKQ